MGLLNWLKNRSMADPTQQFHQLRDGSNLSPDTSANSTVDELGSQYVHVVNQQGEEVVVAEGAPLAPATASVTTASVGIVAANANRTAIIITNLSDQWIYMAWDTAAVLDSGIAIGPGGGTFNARTGQAWFNKGELRAIHRGTGNKTVSIQEYE